MHCCVSCRQRGDEVFCFPEHETRVNLLRPGIIQSHILFPLSRLLSPSPSEYVKEVSLYITNHGLNFKVLDKNDLTLHL